MQTKNSVASVAIGSKRLDFNMRGEAIISFLRTVCNGKG